MMRYSTGAPVLARLILVRRVSTMRTKNAATAIATLALIAVPGVALAGITAVPGPIAGAGLLPVLAVAGGALWLMRKVRARRR